MCYNLQLWRPRSFWSIEIKLKDYWTRKKEPVKIVPKSDEQRKRLQAVANKIMLLNRLDEVSVLFKHT